MKPPKIIWGKPDVLGVIHAWMNNARVAMVVERRGRFHVQSLYWSSSHKTQNAAKRTAEKVVRKLWRDMHHEMHVRWD
jgi:hypothetical protein